MMRTMLSSKGRLLWLMVLAIWSVVLVTGYRQVSSDPRTNKRLNDALVQNSRYHCYYKCHQNPEDCSNEARRDLTTCERLLYWVYFTNYQTCVHDCNNASCSEECRLYMDCEYSCLRIAQEKVRLSQKTPDELIRTYYKARRCGYTNVYIQ